MAWREFVHKDISLLWEHNALTCHFNIMNNITLVFCTIHVTIHFSQRRHASAANGSPDWHTYWRSYISLNILSMIFLILFAPNTTMALVAMTVKYRLMWMLCVSTVMHDIVTCHNSKLLWCLIVSNPELCPISYLEHS